LRKLTLVLAFAACLTGLAALGSAGAATKPKAGGAKLTINAFPEGVFGYLSGAKKSCLDGRKVVVYEQSGDQRDPSSDRMIGADRTSLDEGSYRYAVETPEVGRFYAQTAAKKGCAEAMTGAVGAMNLGNAPGSSGIPICSPYTAETPAEMCALQSSGTQWGLSYQLDAIGTRACEIGKTEYECTGHVSGPFPWGASSGGYNNSVTFGWKPYPNGEKRIYIFTQGNRGYGSSLIEGRLPNPGSADLHVFKSTVVTDSGGTVEFFTPDLPGQKAGEPGGPLYLNFENGKRAFGLGADAYIRGFLYIRR
jgi:hypothetical protein